MGHVSYQNTLERIFTQYIPEVEFKSLHLSDYYKEDFFCRLTSWLLSKKIGFSAVDYDFHRFRAELGLSFLARRCLERYVKIYQPNVLHVHTQGLAMLAPTLFRRVPSVVSIDYTTALLAKEHPQPARITYQPIVALERQCFQAATHIISCSERARTSVINDYGIELEKVTHIDYPLALELFTGMPSPKKLTLGLPRLLFVGNDFVRKGGEDLLAVFLENFSDTCELDLVTNAVVQLPVMPNLRIHRGLRPLSPEILSLYSQADIFVMPTADGIIS